MTKGYFELRIQSAKGTDSIAADVMRHLHARQYLGKAMIICNNPIGLFSASRKQWLKLSRVIQKLRASTLNADKILKHTHTIAHMQHMRFSHKTPLQDPEADVYFLRPDQCDVMPFHCYSVYVIAPPAENTLQTLITHLPTEGLIVDYSQEISWEAYGLQPKSVLEDQVKTQWQQVEQFLHTHDIHPNALIYKDIHDVEAMEDALDTLLGVSHSFMRIANDFQRALELARPLRISRSQRDQYDALILLAHRVQALSPGAFKRHFLEVYNEDDSLFLYDAAAHTREYYNEQLAAAVSRHKAAGRIRLAQALHAKLAYL